jgi:hypothetical protein
MIKLSSALAKRGRRTYCLSATHGRVFFDTNEREVAFSIRSSATRVPLARRTPLQGVRLQRLLDWSNGERSHEPLNIVAIDDPVSL